MAADPVDLVVLGAGPAGLAAAWRAAQRGLSVAVVERASGPGGLAASFEVGGLRVDHGSHRLHPTTDPAILAALQSLLGADLQLRRRNGRIRLQDRWIAFPLRTGDLLRRLPPGFAAAAARDAVTAPLRRPRADTFAEVVRAGLGPTMWERFYEPYAHKIWGVDPALLDGEQARRRVGANTPGKLLRKLLGQSGPPLFWYPRRGFGQIPEALAEAAAGAGATIHHGHAVTGVRLDSTGVAVQTEGGTLRAANVWSTIPLPVLVRLAHPAPPPAVAAAASALRLRALVLVYLVVDREQWTPFDAHYLPQRDTPVTRVSEPRNYRDGDDPPGRTVLCAEIPCGGGDEIWRSADSDLGALVTGHLASLGLPPVTPVEVAVRRVPGAYPIYTAGYAANFATVDAWADQQPRLLTFGRQGLFAHDNTHHAMAMAWAAAGALEPDGGVDAVAWSGARERFRSHVVED